MDNYDNYLTVGGNVILLKSNIEYSFFDQVKCLQSKTIEYSMNNASLNQDAFLDCMDYPLLDVKEILHFQAHRLIVSNIIYEFLSEEKGIPLNELEKYFSCLATRNRIHEKPKIQIKGIHSIRELGDLLETLHIQYLNSRAVYGNGETGNEAFTILAKRMGVVYTPYKIAYEITMNTINNIERTINPTSIKILDFGSGTGRFYLSALDYLSKKHNLDKKAILENLYAIDIDPIALDILKVKILSMFESASLDYIEVLEAATKNIVNKHMLIEDESFNGVIYERDFASAMEAGGFDVILSNPPYFLLKINEKSSGQRHYKMLKERIKREIEYFRRSDKYSYSTEGMLNYYKLSIETILRLCKDGGEIGIICPSTIFGDISSKKLRKYLLLDNKLRGLRFFPESAKIFPGITQSVVIFYLQKNGKTDEISVCIDDQRFTVSLAKIRNVFSETYEIPYINDIGWGILKKLSRLPKLKEISGIRNKRGELDITLHRRYVTRKDTGWRLVRGNMVTENCILDRNCEFVLIEDFLKTKSKEYKEKDFNKERLVCQQISNMSKKKRLYFVKSRPTDIIANSCNYISSDSYNLDKLAVVLNSYLLDWRFRITSSNNHISNNEIGELPIADIALDDLSCDKLTDNIKVCTAYGLTEREIFYILGHYYNREVIEKVI